MTEDEALCEIEKCVQFEQKEKSIKVICRFLISLGYPQVAHDFAHALASDFDQEE